MFELFRKKNILTDAIMDLMKKILVVCLDEKEADDIYERLQGHIDSGRVDVALATRSVKYALEMAGKLNPDLFIFSMASNPEQVIGMAKKVSLISRFRLSIKFYIDADSKLKELLLMNLKAACIINRNILADEVSSKLLR